VSTPNPNALTEPSSLRLSIPSIEFELSCGARLIVSPRAKAAVTSLVVSIEGGARLDPVGREGTAQLAGSLAVEGTERHSESELAAILEPLGGSLVGDASGLSASAAAVGTPESPDANWRTLLDLAAEVLVRPTYPIERFERRKSIALERLRVDEADPRVQVGRLFNTLMYGNGRDGTSGIGRPRRGTFESVSGIERDDLVRWHAETWVASRTIIGICGDLEPEAVRDHLESALAGWRTGVAAPPIDDRFPPRTTRIATFRAEREQVQLLAGHLGIRRLDPRYAACVVMDHVLGTGPGFTDRISKRLRDEEGLAYSVSATTAASAGRVEGVFQASIATSPDKVAAALAGFVEEMERIRTEPVTPDELHLVKQYLSGSFAMGFEKTSRRASQVVTAARLGLPEGHLDQLLDDLLNVDAEAVLACAHDVLDPRALSVAVAGPLDEATVRAHLDAARAGLTE
jgi:zinc protease